MSKKIPITPITLAEYELLLELISKVSYAESVFNALALVKHAEWELLPYSLQRKTDEPIYSAEGIDRWSDKGIYFYSMVRSPYDESQTKQVDLLPLEIILNPVGIIEESEKKYDDLKIEKEDLSRTVEYNTYLRLKAKFEK